MELANQEKTLIVDGMALLFRAYYATSYSGYIRKTSTGTPTNAIYGFLQYFFDAIDEYEPTHVICCWDMGSKTFRSELYPPYKANRGEPPQELIPQFDLVKDVVASLGIRNFGVPGFEADDCIGTISNRICSRTGVVILTGDHDMLQLVSDRIFVAIMKKGKGNYELFTPASLWEKKELEPEQIIDLKALMGDTSDNYPGVRGIGEKTALKLIKEFKSVNGLLENAGMLSKSIKAKIEENKEMMLLSKVLATIKTDVPLDCTIEECRLEVTKEAAASKFRELEFESLLKLIS